VPPKASLDIGVMRQLKILLRIEPQVFGSSDLRLVVTPLSQVTKSPQDNLVTVWR
jgi:hypothetical protein